MDSSIDEELFLERLETLYEKELSDVRAFAQREHRPYDEVRPQTAHTDSLSFELTTSKVRNRLAELHCKDLFDFHRDGDEKSPGKEQSEGHHDGTEAHSYDRLTLPIDSIKHLAIHFTSSRVAPYYRRSSVVLPRRKSERRERRRVPRGLYARPRILARSSGLRCCWGTRVPNLLPEIAIRHSDTRSRDPLFEFDELYLPEPRRHGDTSTAGASSAVCSDKHNFEQEQPSSRAEDGSVRCNA